jgi:hypothetical protein
LRGRFGRRRGLGFKLGGRVAAVDSVDATVLK